MPIIIKIGNGVSQRNSSWSYTRVKYAGEVETEVEQKNVFVIKDLVNLGY